MSNISFQQLLAPPPSPDGWVDLIVRGRFRDTRILHRMHLMTWEMVWKEGFFLLCYGIDFAFVCFLYTCIHTAGDPAILCFPLGLEGSLDSGNGLRNTICNEFPTFTLREF
jgi:hypothetical protein